MKRFFYLLLSAVCVLFVIDCSEQASSGPNTVQTLQPESGRFGLSSLGSLAKRSSATAVKSEPQVTFNLGQIRGSSGFFFLLYNVGVTAITDVTLSMEHQGCTVFPASMDTLIPGSDVGMLPIVKVSAFHGTPFDGVGTRPLLPMGDNTLTLHIQGNSKTASGDDTTITLDAELNLEAMIMALDMESDNGPINYGTSRLPFQELFSGVDGLQSEPVYYGKTGCENDNNIIIKNSGNVPLHISVYNSEENINSQREVTHRFDSTVAVAGVCQFTFDADAVNQHYLIIASGENTVSDPQTLPLHDNGSFYLVVTQSNAKCEDTLINRVYSDFKAAHADDDCAQVFLFLDNKIAFYGQSFNNSDSVDFSLTDLTTNTLITSCAGTSSADETILVQTDGYTGEYLSVFRVIISSIFMRGETKIEELEGRITSGTMSGDWIRSTSVTYE